MGTILGFKPLCRESTRRAGQRRDCDCEIVIFPGTRIDRPTVDLGYRLRDTLGRAGYGEGGDKDRSRRTP
ncbi:hypothetical protein [Bauldia litoralis]|uniref:hypothetical protein n=1 Tax=Bauldia litoralis TaxID=665467 RepID=UPI003267F42A